MDRTTHALSRHIKRKGISIAAIASGTGLKPGVLYPSLSGERPLRADEFLAICEFVGVDPMLLRTTTDQAG